MSNDHTYYFQFIKFQFDLRKRFSQVYAVNCVFYLISVLILGTCRFFIFWFVILRCRGYNIGIRLVDEFLAKSNVSRCVDFRETAEVIAKVLVLLLFSSVAVRLEKYCGISFWDFNLTMVWSFCL